MTKLNLKYILNSIDQFLVSLNLEPNKDNLRNIIVNFTDKTTGEIRQYSYKRINKYLVNRLNTDTSFYPYKMEIIYWSNAWGGIKRKVVYFKSKNVQKLIKKYRGVK